MKILHVVYNSVPDVTGGAIRTRYLVEAQSRLGVRAVVLSAPFQSPADASQPRGVEYCNGIPYYRCYDGSNTARFMAPEKTLWERAVRLRALIPFARRIYEVALEEDIDLIHAHSLFFCGLAAMLAGRRLGVPVVYEVRSLIEEGMEGAGPVSRRLYRAFDLLACRLASHVTVISDGLRHEMIRRGVPARKITVAGNGVDVDAHTPDPRAGHLPSPEFVLGYIGTLVAYEGLDLLIDAVRILAARRPEVRLLIVGDGSARALLEEQVRRAGIENVVRFAGRVPHEEIGSWYRRIDLFILPRRPNCLTDAVTPLKPLEIMAHGKPLLAGDCGGHRELIRPGINGLIFGSFDAADLAGRIEVLMNDREGLARLGMHAREWVSSHRSWDAQSRPVTDLYQNLIRQASGSEVLVVAPAPRPVPTGGVETGVAMICRSELLRRHQIRIWDRTRARIFEFARFAICLATFRPQIVHIKASSGLNFFQSALYALIGRILGRRVLIQLHSGDFENWYKGRAAIVRWAIRCALRLPSQLLALSECWRDLLWRLAPGRPVRIVPNGVEISTVPAPRKPADGVLRVLTIATLGCHKGHFEILEAAHRLRRHPIRFILAGPDKTSGRGEGKLLRQYAKDLGVSDLVEFAGAVDHQKKWELLSTSDVFLLPSRAEGMPNAVLEAMAAGLPVVAGRVGALPEMLGDGMGGSFVEIGSGERVAEAVLELLRDPAKREAMGEWNRCRAREQYSFERVEAILDELYAEPERSVLPQLGRTPGQKPKLVAGFAVFLLVGELAARLAAPAPPQWRWPQTRFESSATLGFKLQPNQRSYTADQLFRSNSLGLRGLEPVRKTPGVRRLLILGDSIASGYGVSEHETFVCRLQGLLNARKNGRFEVINAGVPSYNTAQEVDYLAERGLALRPDLVVLALYWNDIHDKAAILVDSEGRLIETYTSDPGGLMRSQLAYEVRNLVKRSRLLYLVLDRWRAASFAFRPPMQRETQMAVLEGAGHPRVEQGWQVVETNLVRLSRLCSKQGIRALVLILPMPQQLAGRFPKARYQTVVRPMCKRAGLPTLDLLPAFERNYRGHASLFLPYDGDHPNARGHALIARELFETICPKEHTCLE